MTVITLKRKLTETDAPTKGQVLIACGEIAQALEPVHYVEIVDVSDDLTPSATPVVRKRTRGPNKPKQQTAPEVVKPNGASQIDAFE